MAKVLVYQLWPIAWKGGLKAMERHLERVKSLGCTHVWLSPLYPSPRKDHGYDIADYKAIDKRFGTMDDFDDFVKAAHGLGLKVLMDLVLNHTSTEHKWFSRYPEYYIWSEKPKTGWKNLFDGGSAWKFDGGRGKYYCHLFHEKQADLAWFDAKGKINQALVKEFRDIVEFWTKYHRVDGFRLDVPQSINKNIDEDVNQFEKMLFGTKSIDVLNAVFPKGQKNPFLISEVFDPTWGKIIEEYVKETEVKFCFNVLLKEQRDVGLNAFFDAFFISRKTEGFILDLESHDSPRFTSRSGMLGRQVGHIMFDRAIQAICIYQGQELGLKNPALTAKQMATLDAQSAMRIRSGKEPAEVARTSRANARVPIPVEEYEIQAGDDNSSLNWWRFYASHWKKGK